MFDLFNHRGRDVADAAASAGVEYADGDPLSCTKAPLPLLHRGDARTVERVLWRATDPHSVRVFELRYETSAGRRRDVSPLYTCATALVNASWPNLLVTPHPLVDLREEYEAGGDEVHLESEAFGEAFHVRSPDPRFASAFLDPRMLQFLLDKARALTIELHGSWLLVYAESVPAPLLPELFPFVDELLAHVPAVVDSLYPPPLPGGLATPVPPPAALAPDAGGADDERRSAERAVDEITQHTPTFWRGGGFAGGAAVSGAAAEVAIQQEILADPSWRALDRSPFEGLERDDESPDEPQYDLDGHPVSPHREDPWGEGRPEPHDADGT